MQNLQIGIAGYGIVGKRRHKSLSKIKNIKVVAICDKKIKNEGINRSGIKLLKNYNKLLLEGIDAIIICMTNDIAPLVTLEAIKKNIHVFCEKPPGRNMEDIIKVIRAYKKNPHLKVMYGFNHRYHYSIDYAKNIIDKKKYGKIISLRGVYGKSKMITFNQNDWRTKRKIAGGGVLLDQGIHLIDLMRYFVGDFNEVKSFVSNDYWKFDVEDNVY
ncbi:Gfo/Idh/MocA family oxidoreductase, partial [Pelagibacteraceae bacterium]|nr:Gfo/Idh/MocA family oxidoreductase [Pelagibacteraceae bacterium]